MLSLAGAASVGQEVAVFWGGDSAWYSGAIAGFDASTWKHRVHYLDGDREDLSLTSHLVRGSPCLTVFANCHPAGAITLRCKP